MRILRPARIKAKRYELGLTQQELADEVGIRVESVCASETYGNRSKRVLVATLRRYREECCATLSRLCEEAGIPWKIVDVDHIQPREFLDARIKQDQKQRVVAEAISQSHTYVSLVERGKKSMIPATQERLQATKRRLALYYGLVDVDPTSVTVVEAPRVRLTNLETRVTSLETRVMLLEGESSEEIEEVETISIVSPVRLPSTEFSTRPPLEYWFLELHSMKILAPEQASEKGLVLTPIGKILLFEDDYLTAREVSDQYVAFSIISDIPPGNFLPDLIHRMLDRPIS